MTAWYFHNTLAYVIYIYGIYFYGICFYGTYFYKAKKILIILWTDLCTKRELLYKYVQKQNLQVKRIFV
jgi:hypothetical protein